LDGASEGIQIGAPDSETERHAEEVSRRATNGSPGGELLASGSLQIAAFAPGASRAGAQLDPAVRDRVEPLVGADLGGVRVHDDTPSRHAAAALSARAFTIGGDIHLGPGESASDVGLMAHEAAHTVQQSSSGESIVQRDATNQSITESYAAALDDGGLMFETQMVESALSGSQSTDSVNEVLNANLAVLRAEAGKRNPGANTVPEPRAPQPSLPRVTEIPEGGTSIGKMGVVNRDTEPFLRLRTTPDTDTTVNIVTTLPFSARVLVIKSFPGNWYFVSAPNGDMGYVADMYVWTDLPEPNARLHRVEPGQSAIGIAERYYGEYGRDWGQDLRFYVNVLAWANKIPVPDRTFGWRQVHFKAGQFIWIPSQPFAYSLKGAVNSGSITWNIADAIGLAGFIERLGELWDDFHKALDYSEQYKADALQRHIEEAARGMVEGLVTMIKLAVAILAITTAIGAILGGIFGVGAGAAPGAAAGFEVGMVIIEWLGLAMLVVWIGQALAQLAIAFGSFLATVWDARGNDEKLKKAGRQWADAIATMIAKILEGLLMLVMARGLPKGIEALKGTRLGAAVGETRGAQWLSERSASIQRGDSPLPSPSAVIGKVRGTGRPGAEPAGMRTQGQAEAFHQLPADRLPANLPDGHFWMRSADGSQWVLMREAGATPAPFELTVFSDAAAGRTNYVLRSGDRMIQSDAITRTGSTHQGADRLPPDLTGTGANNPYRDPVTGRAWDKGHGIDHADTLAGPGVRSSTVDPANFTPQASWWNQGPRNSLVGRIRDGHPPSGRPGGGGYREMALYAENPPVTANGTPIPREFIFVETNAAGAPRLAWRIPNQHGAAGRAITSIDPLAIPLAEVPPIMLRSGLPTGGPGGGFYAPGIVFGMPGDNEKEPTGAAAVCEPDQPAASVDQQVCMP
jgi:hypothetical protein